MVNFRYLISTSIRKYYVFIANSGTLKNMVITYCNTITRYEEARTLESLIPSRCMNLKYSR